jgi:hypothetical protein
MSKGNPIDDGDRREMHDLAFRYARAADRRDYAEFANLFIENGKISGHNGDPETNPPLYEMQGVDVIQQGMKGLEKYEMTYHLVANQLLWPESADEVSGETYCTAHHLETRDDGVRTDYTMFIRYQDRFVRTTAGWRFRERKLVVDFDRQAPLAS